MYCSNEKWFQIEERRERKVVSQKNHVSNCWKKNGSGCERDLRKAKAGDLFFFSLTLIRNHDNELVYKDYNKENFEIQKLK